MTTLVDPELLQSVIDSPKEDAPRLVYADWLEEHGELERAELIRVQIELARGPFGYNKELDIPDHRFNTFVQVWRNRVLELSKRESELLSVGGRVFEWLGDWTWKCIPGSPAMSYRGCGNT